MKAAGLDRERLCKLLGLLSSDFAGERAEAGRAADRLVREAGLRWPDVILPALTGPNWHDEIETVEDAIEECLCFPRLLTQWEYDFLRNLSRQRSPISPKQIAVVDRIFAKVRRAEARAV